VRGAAAVGLAAAIVAGCQGGRAAPGASEIWIGGDLQLGTDGSDAAARLAPLRELLSDAIGVVNLEGPVVDGVAGEGHGGGRLVVFNGRALVDGLRRAGVAVAGIANNHAEDDEAAGIARTVAVLREAGVVPAGGVAGAAVVVTGGRRIVVTAHDLADGVPEGLGGELAAARAQGDLLIATFHVTGPPSYLPPPALREAVEQALAAGARVVAAHGSHVVGAVERRGDAVIAWGLGNLLFRCDCTRESEGLLLRVSVGRDGSLRAAAMPITAGLGGEAARLSDKPDEMFDLLGALRSTALRRDGPRAWF
jgi:poly-gamma-glutamate capsule biosynthesis protein CapA/YwtB (metallophosphatase superfamily)